MHTTAEVLISRFELIINVSVQHIPTRQSHTEHGNHGHTKRATN